MRYVIGIDEVGRGSLAGPVAVAAVAIPKNLELRKKDLGKLRDSKKLTRLGRERWHAYFKKHPQVRYVIARVYPRGIEKMNISRAANLAAERAYTRLLVNHKSTIINHSIYLDGGLYLGNNRGLSQTIKRGTTRTVLRLSASSPRLSATTIVRGDQKINAIKAASIIAKVSRDHYMTRLARKYPRYGFEIHKGYGTKAHRAALKRHGPSEVHRLTFIGFLKNSKL